MAQFRYIACDANGASLKGHLLADSLEAAGHQLDAQGLIPLDIHPVQTFSVRPKRDNTKVGWRVEDKVLFTRKLASLLKAGIPLLKVFDLVASQTTDVRVQTAIRHVGDMIASGHTLSEAMAAYPRLFDPVFLGALRTGEATGRLDTVLEQTADFIEREMVTRRMIKATLRYPILVIVAMIVASVVILGFVVPKFMAFYTQYGGQLPLPTRVLLAVAHLVESFWWVLPPLALGGWYFWWRWTRTEKGRQRRDEWALRIPLLGHLFLKVAVSRFARLFGVLFSAGVPAATALETVAQAVGNSVVAGEVDAMRERLSTGESISDRPGNAVMPNLVYQMLGIGFESGDVERMLGEVARHFDQEVEYDIRRLKDNIEPIILLILAVGVLTLALAVLMPMWNLISLFQQ